MKIKNFTTSDCIIDREEDIDQLKNILINAKKTQVHMHR